MKKDEESTSGIKKIFSNTSWLLIKSVYSGLCSLVIGAISARFLGPSNFGYIGYSASLVAVFMSISQLGLSRVIINECIVEPKNCRDYLSCAVTLRIISSIIACVTIFFLIQVMNPGNKLLCLITVLQSLALIFQATDVFSYWYQIELKFKYIAFGSMIAATVVGIWQVILLVNCASVEWFAASSSIQAFALAVVTSTLFYIHFPEKITISLRHGKYLLSKSWHYILADIGIMIYMQADKLMVGMIINEEAVGFYTAATSVAYLWNVAAAAVIDAARPVIQKERIKNREKYLKYFKLLLMAVIMISVLACTIICIFSKLFIFILYGEAYYPAITSLNIMVWAAGFAMIGSASSIWFVAESLNKYSKYIVLTGTIVNIALNAILIPICGIEGAACATLISQIVVALIAPACIPQTRVFCKIFFESFREIKKVFSFILALIKNQRF